MPFEEEEDEASQTLHSKNVEIALKHVFLHWNHANISLASFLSKIFPDSYSNFTSIIALVIKIDVMTIIHVDGWIDAWDYIYYYNSFLNQECSQLYIYFVVTVVYHFNLCNVVFLSLNILAYSNQNLLTQLEMIHHWYFVKTNNQWSYYQIS